MFCLHFLKLPASKSIALYALSHSQALVLTSGTDYIKTLILLLKFWIKESVVNTATLLPEISRIIIPLWRLIFVLTAPYNFTNHFAPPSDKSLLMTRQGRSKVVSTFRPFSSNFRTLRQLTSQKWSKPVQFFALIAKTASVSIILR